MTRGIDNILRGVLKYQTSLKSELTPIFREILDKPSPKSIIIGCVDSRIVVSRLLQAQPGNNFLVRSPGNFIPKFIDLEKNEPSSTPAALELACVNNEANTVVVMGHSDCRVYLLIHY
jgi:carbonic anhydrase